MFKPFFPLLSLFPLWIPKGKWCTVPTSSGYLIWHPRAKHSHIQLPTAGIMFVILRCLRIFQSSSVRGTQAVSSFPSTPYLFPSLLPFNSFTPSLSASLKKKSHNSDGHFKISRRKATRPTGQWPSCFAVKSATGFIIAVADVLWIPANKNTEGGEVCQVRSSGGEADAVSLLPYPNPLSNYV